MNSTCCILNIATHYHEPIFRKMDDELFCDFYFGNRISTPIKQIDPTTLKGFKGFLTYLPLMSKFYWQRGALKHVFEKYENFILIGEPYCLSNWAIIIFARLLHKKTYLWSHGWYGNETFMKKKVKKAFFNLANFALLYGEYAKQLMINEGINKDKLYCFYNSLDYELQLKIRNVQKESDIYSRIFKNQNPVLLYVGRLQKVKRLDLVIEAIFKLKNEGVDCNLIIIGKDIEKIGLEELISNMNLNENVYLYGECYDENKLGEMIFNADICVSPGNVGLTAIHSLMYGTPVITNGNFKKQMPEFEAIIVDETGDFFEENEIESLTSVLNNWLTNHRNDRDLIREKAYSVIDEKYNPDYQIRLLKSIFNRY